MKAQDIDWENYPVSTQNSKICVLYWKEVLILHAKYKYEMELTRTTGVRKNAERKKQIKKGNSSVRKYKLIE